MQILHYLWTLYWELPGSWKQKKTLLSRMYSSIRDYVSEGAEPDYTTLVNRFGEPKSIAAEYIAQMDNEELLTGLRIRQRVIRIIVVTVATMLILWTTHIVLAYTDHRKNVEGYLVVEEIVVESIIWEGE